MKSVLSEVLPYLPSVVEGVFRDFSDAELSDLREIRLREFGPLLLVFGTGRKVYDRIRFAKEDIDATFRKVCGSSSYTHRSEIRSGFVTLPGGHRVGIVGTAVMGENGRVEGVRDVSGLVFRIARDCSVPVEELVSRMCLPDRVRNALIAGPPCSGKTTVLRAMVRRLALQMQVAVIDERSELFPSRSSIPVGCDVLRGYPKAAGILQALRTLSPAVIVCDEIGTSEEVVAMGDGLRSGVSLLVSAHAHTSEELLKRPPIRDLIALGGIDFAAFLRTDQVGTVREILEKDALRVENSDVASVVSAFYGLRPDVCG